MPKRYRGTMTEFLPDDYEARQQGVNLPAASAAVSSPRCSSRETCTCDTPSDPRRLLLRQALEKPKQDRHPLLLRQAVNRLPERDALRSGSSSGLSVPRVDSSVSPSAVSCCKDSGATVARSMLAISSGVTPGLRRELRELRLAAEPAAAAARAPTRASAPARGCVRPTFMAPSSRRNRRISPAIFGTA